ncbi:MAG: PAS domain S-box protein, partial [Acidobacteriaceae bacterium]|nr:PAS domain S-box protein [Acidobacteriaceae bacterium]
MGNAQGSTPRSLSGITQIGSDAVHSALHAISRFDLSIASNSWTLEDFWTNYGWLITTSLAMIICFVGAIPNAVAFLIIAVVHSVFVAGYRTGIASATLSTLYAALVFSNPDAMFHFSGEGLRGFLGISGGCYGTVFLIMYLRRKDLKVADESAEKILAQDVSAATETKFREFANAAPVLLWLADERGDRYFFNSLWSKFTGQNVDNLVGRGWKDNIHAEDADLVLRRYASAVRSCERYEAEYRIRSSDGDYRWVQDFGVPRISAEGTCIGYIGSCVDRTERKRVERALHQLSGKLLGLQDEERRRISRELHDTTAQNLAVLSMNLCVVKEATRQLPQRMQDAVTESLALAEQCSQEIRTLSYVLHPPLLD